MAEAAPKHEAKESVCVREDVQMEHQPSLFVCVPERASVCVLADGAVEPFGEPKSATQHEEKESVKKNEEKRMCGLVCVCVSERTCQWNTHPVCVCVRS